MLKKGDKLNFRTLERAFHDGSVALMEVVRKSDGKKVAAVCAVSFDGKEYTMTPFATLVEGNPYELFAPPDPNGGFYGWPERGKVSS